MTRRGDVIAHQPAIALHGHSHEHQRYRKDAEKVGKGMDASRESAYISFGTLQRKAASENFSLYMVSLCQDVFFVK